MTHLEDDNVAVCESVYEPQVASPGVSFHFILWTRPWGFMPILQMRTLKL